MMTTSAQDLPDFLQSYEDLNNYIRDTLEDLDATSKGRSFARFVSKVISISTLGDRFVQVDVGPDAKDGGVDLTSISTDGKSVLYGQSKLTISRVEDIDTIISKFKDYYERVHTNKTVQMFAFPDVPAVVDKTKPKQKKGRGPAQNVSLNVDQSQPEEVTFGIMTLSKIKTRIIPEYERSRMASKDFYNTLKAEGKIVILDGPDILPLAQSAYRKLHVIPSNLDITFVTNFINQNNVFIGVMTARELKECYRKFGDALFLENIRLFLGYSEGKYDRENVNDSIRDTAENRPNEMLARNNGITFRASKVRTTSGSSLHLEQASIVNGCQTTMCIVQSSSDDACILVKIVEVSESWEVAKSANFQNKVDQIALDVARYMRPQALRQAASRNGFLVEDKSNSLYDIFDAIYQDKVQYDESFYLFIGLFSSSPTNIIKTDYFRLRNDMLENFRQRDPDGEKMFDLLFKLYRSTAKGRDVAEAKYQSEPYRTIFQRFRRDDKPDYRSMVTVLAATGCVRENIYNNNIDINQMEAFIDKLVSILTNDEDKFIRFYCYAYEAIMSYVRITNAGKTEKEIQKSMYDDLRNSDFSTLYDQICILADGRE